MEIAIGIILIISAIFLIVAVLMQHGKSHNLSGTIAGGAETFFGKSKASTLDKKLSKLTTIVAVVFTLLVLVSYLMQDTTDFSGYVANTGDTITSTDTTADDDDTVGEEDTTAVDEGADVNGETEADTDTAAE